MVGNIYPVNAAMYLQDALASMAMVIDDRSQGGALLHGALELMVQRRNLADDDKGVAEPLNETCGGMTPYPPYGNGTWVGDSVIVQGASFVSRERSGVCQSHTVRDDAAFAEPLVLVGMAPGVVAADDDDDAVCIPWPNSKMPLAVL